MKSSLHWSGVLTYECRQLFVDSLWTLLSGKTYTQVIIMRSGRPEVTTDQRLIALSKDDAFNLRLGNIIPFFTASDTWCISYGSTFSFEGNKVTIEQANRDQCIYLVFAVQARGTRHDRPKR